MLKHSPFVRLLAQNQAYRPKAMLATLYSVLNKLFDILPEVLIGIAVDVVVKRENSFLGSLGVSSINEQLVLLGFLTLIIWGLESLSQYLHQISWRNLAQSIQHDLRIATYSHVQSLDMAYFEDQSAGNLLAIMNDDVNQLERFFDTGINNLLQLIVSAIAIAGIFFYLAPSIAVLSMLPIPVILLLAFRFRSGLSPRYELVRHKSGLIAAMLSNNLSGIATIKSYVKEEYEKNRLKICSNDYQAANRLAIKLSSAFIPVVRMAIVMGFIATIVMGGFYAIEGKLSIASYSVLVFLTQRLLWPFTQLAEITDQFERAMASARRVLNLLDQPISISSGHTHILKEDLKGHISFDHVSLIYPNGFRALNNITLDVLPGQNVAFVGATGSGKSSIVKLLLRFYAPSTGTILIDAHPLHDLHLLSLRYGIGLVSQDAFLFQGTIFDNIAYSNPSASLKEVQTAAKLAEADQFIEELPLKYQTIVGEYGQRLSGGQKQRISLARVILKNPPILVLDEATSAVDNETEQAIQRSLATLCKNRTTIMIAHRLSTIRNADVVYVLDRGGIAEQGTHDELVAKRGIYHTLWNIQTGQK